MLALAGAVVWYVNWSSDVAWQEFISANKPPLSGPNHQPQSQAPVQTVKGKAVCAQESLSRKPERADYSVTVWITLLTGRLATAGSFMSLISEASYSASVSSCTLAFMCTTL